MNLQRLIRKLIKFFIFIKHKIFLIKIKEKIKEKINFNEIYLISIKIKNINLIRNINNIIYINLYNLQHLVHMYNIYNYILMTIYIVFITYIYFIIAYITYYNNVYDILINLLILCNIQIICINTYINQYNSI